MHVHNYYFSLNKLFYKSKTYKAFQALLLAIVALLLITTNLYAEYVPNQIIVKYKNGIAATRSITINNSRYVMKQHSMPEYLIENTFLLQTTDNVTNSIDMLQSDPDIEYAQPNYIVYARKTPNDPWSDDHGSLDYHFLATHGINAEKGWDIITDSPDVIVAVLDTGIDYDHEDLIDTVDQTKGYNAFTGAEGVATANDDHWHGTHVAGIIGAKGNNRIGITGITWKSNLVAVKVLAGSGEGDTAKTILGINYAIRIGAKVINASLGAAPNQINQAEYEAVKKAVDNDIVLIAAAGNGRSNTDYDPEYPAAYAIRGVISVGASDDKSAVWTNDTSGNGSSTGRTSVHLFAPGSAIWSTIIQEPNMLVPYRKSTGTSMATPIVAGAVSLLLAHHSKNNITLNPSQVEQLLVNSVRPVESMKTQSMSGGILDLEKLLKFNINSLYDAPTNFKIEKIAGTNASVRLSWEAHSDAQIEIYAKDSRNTDFVYLDRLRAGTTEYIDKYTGTATIDRYYRIRALKSNVYTPFVQISNRKFEGNWLTNEYLRLSAQNEEDEKVEETPEHGENPDDLDFDTVTPIPIINPTNLDFGDININQTSSSKTVTVSNNGINSFSITSVTIADTTDTAFNIATNNCNGKALTNNDTCDITVTFRPTEIKTYNNDLEIVTDFRATPYTVNLTGQGKENSGGFLGGCSIGSSNDHLFMLILLILAIRGVTIFRKIARR